MKLSLFLVAISLSFSALAGGVFEDLSFRQALQVAKAENKKLFIVAYTENCDKAKKLLEKLEKSNIKEANAQEYVAIKMNMNKLENNYRVSNWGLRASPTVVVMNPAKRTLFSSGIEGANEGTKTAEEVQAILNNPSAYQLQEAE